MKRYIPDYYNESNIIKELLQITGKELDYLFQLNGELLNNTFMIKATWMIEEWERQFSIIPNATEALEVRISRIISYTYTHNRIRRVDLEAIVRQFLLGPKAYVLQGYIDSTKIRVSTTSGFTIGETIFISSESAVLIDILVPSKELVLDSTISPYPYSLVSNQPVNIIDDPSTYTFTIILNPSLVSDLNALTAAIELAKPAHLDFSITFDQQFSEAVEITENLQTDELPADDAELGDPVGGAEV